MKSRIGKIARLPLDLRDELNHRLSDGEPAHSLIAWLNADPEVLAILREQFDGQLISEQNVSAWRQGGYMEWALVRECAATANGLSESSEDIAATGIKAEHLLTVLTCQYARLLNQWENLPYEELNKKLNILKKLTNAALALRRREFQALRLELDRDRHELAREKQLSKSASSASSRASASTESTGSTRKKPAKHNAPVCNAPTEAGFAHVTVSAASAISSNPVVNLEEVLKGFAPVKSQPAILSGRLSPAPPPGAVQMMNAGLARSGAFANLV